ncbi:ferredoxin [Amycolatopsis sp. cg5]|uniref:ferredoxin n=1 Tax=Amycolatopsis sp. cg5 TaxID=3238802 RepID=UPI000B888463|nr:ferredoxin [Amycolatopsis xylanica]
MRILYDRERCVGTGSCVFAEPAVFDQDEDDGRLVVLDENPDEDYRQGVLDAIAVCPVAAIELAKD